MRREPTGAAASAVGCLHDAALPCHHAAMHDQGVRTQCTGCQKELPLRAMHYQGVGTQCTGCQKQQHTQRNEGRDA